VSATAEVPLGRGRQELKAAEALLEAGFPAQAVSHAYRAGLHAASAALAVLGEVPATSSGVISAFGRHVVGENGIDHETARVLRRLCEDRNDVDYGLVDVPLEQARDAVADGSRFVEAIALWIGSKDVRRPPAEPRE
jgi:uncharacterized protein (UPF0332 family)